MEHQFSYSNNTLEKTMEVFFLPLCIPGASHMKLLQIINTEMDYVSPRQHGKIFLAMFRNRKTKGCFIITDGKKNLHLHCLKYKLAE